MMPFLVTHNRSELSKRIYRDLKIVIRRLGSPENGNHRVQHMHLVGHTWICRTTRHCGKQNDPIQCTKRM